MNKNKIHKILPYLFIAVTQFIAFLIILPQLYWIGLKTTENNEGAAFELFIWVPIVGSIIVFWLVLSIYFLIVKKTSLPWPWHYSTVAFMGVCLLFNLVWPFGAENLYFWYQDNKYNAINWQVDLKEVEISKGDCFYRKSCGYNISLVTINTPLEAKHDFTNDIYARFVTDLVGIQNNTEILRLMGDEEGTQFSTKYPEDETQSNSFSFDLDQSFFDQDQAIYDQITIELRIYYDEDRHNTYASKDLTIRLNQSDVQKIQDLLVEYNNL